MALEPRTVVIEDRNPELSNLVLDPSTMNEVNRISIPMPAVIPTPPPKRAEAASLWSSEDAIDEARIQTEMESFQSLVHEIKNLWKSVVETHAATDV